MRTLTRLVATNIVAALIATMLSVALTSPATAAPTYTAKKAVAVKHTVARKKYRPFGPQRITYVGARCTKIGPASWKITARFKVQGGRYANLGNPQHGIRWHDNVYGGGTRYISTVERYHGWTRAQLRRPTQVRFTFQQMIAPIKHKRNPAKWRLVYREPVINLSCR